MIRDGIGASAANVLLAMSPGSVNGAFFQFRATSGGSTTTSTNPGIWSPYWVRLARSGNTFTAYCSADGNTWTLVGTAVVTMGATVNIGLAVTASDDNQLNISTIQNVSVTTPTHTWDGGSLVDNLWTTKENWAGDVAPNAGDNLIFPAGAARLDNVNDYSSATNFGSVTVSGSGYHFQACDSSSTSMEVQTGVQLEAGKIITGDLDIGQGATITIAPIAAGPLAASTSVATLELVPGKIVPVQLVKSTGAKLIGASRKQIISRSLHYQDIDIRALQLIIESRLDRSLAVKSLNDANIPAVGSSHGELSSHVKKIEKQPIISAIKNRQEHLAALQTYSRRFNANNAVVELDIAQHVRAGKHSKPLEKAVDKILAEEDPILVEL